MGSGSFGAVTTSAGALARQMLALAQVIAKITGTPVSSGAVDGGPNGSGSYTYPGGPGGTIAPGGSNIHTPGLQFALGGVVPGPIGMPQFATVHGGELVVPVGGFKGNGGAGVSARSGGNTVVQHFHIAGTVVAEKELMQLIRTSSARATSRGTTVFGPN